MVVSVEDVPVATETECEKSNGQGDQTSTECKLALDKKEESVAAAEVEENVIPNGIKSTTLPVEEQPAKIESAATLIEQTADIDSGNPDDVIDKLEESKTDVQNEQSKKSPFRNGLDHDEETDKEEESASEKIVDEDAVTITKKQDEVSEKPTTELLSTKETSEEKEEETKINDEKVGAKTDPVSSMEVDESVTEEPMETTSVADTESSRLENGQDKTAEEAIKTSDEHTPHHEDDKSKETVELETNDELTPSDNANLLLTDKTMPPSVEEDRTPSPPASVAAEQDGSETQPEEANEDDETQLIVDSAPSKPTPSESKCDTKSNVQVKNEEKTEEPPANVDQDKNTAEQVSNAQIKLRVKEELLAEVPASNETTPSLAKSDPADHGNSIPASNGSALTSATVPTPKPATVVAGTKRRADTASEELEADRDGRISSSSSSGSDVENNQDHKRIRFDESIFEEDERERLIREFTAESSEEIGKICDKLQHEIAALSDLARAKELEWNSIIRLLKLKEEMLERVLFKKRSLECQAKNDSATTLDKLYRSVMTPSTSAEQTKSARNEPNVPTSISSQVTVVPISLSNSVAGTSSSLTNSVSTAQNSHDTPYKSVSFGTTPFVDKLRAPHRPILPKPVPMATAALQQTSSPSQPPQSAVATVQPTSHAMPMSAQAMAQSLMQANSANSLLIDRNSVIGEGRQGPIVDVKSIIAEYRSKNPESGPRRGRRNIQFTPRAPDAVSGPRFLPNSALLSMANMALGSGSHVRTNVSSTTHAGEHVRQGNLYLGQDGSISAAALNRPDLQIRQANALDSFMLSISAANSSNSSQSNAGNSAGGGGSGVSIAAAASGSSANTGSGVSVTGSSSGGNSTSFQEALVKFAKMNEKRDMVASSNAHMNAQKNASHLLPPPPYPEVTLHPVLVPQFPNSPQNSLLHGILTKSSSGPNRGGASSGGGGGGGGPGSGVSTGMGGSGGDHHPSSSIGAVTGNMNPSSASNLQHRPTNFSPTLARLLTAPERNRNNRANVGSSNRNTKSALSEILNSKKTRTEVTITPVTTSAACITKNGSDVVMVDDDDESESTDRLVIDEGREAVADPTTNVIPADQVPECQGCHKKAAQFVCAGCGNQWYCSRECQVQAWEEHSEMCSG